MYAQLKIWINRRLRLLSCFRVWPFGHVWKGDKCICCSTPRRSWIPGLDLDLQPKKASEAVYRYHDRR